MTIKIKIEITKKGNTKPLDTEAETTKSFVSETENESDGDIENLVIPKYVLNQADIGDDTELAVSGYNGRIAAVGIYDYDDFDSITFDDLARDLGNCDYELFTYLAEGEYVGVRDELLCVPQYMLDEAEISPESDLRVYKFANSVLIVEDIYGEDF